MTHPRHGLVLLVAILVLAATVPGVACYSGLMLIPTTDTVGAKQFGVEFQVDGSIPTPKADTYILNTEVGITDRIEAGVDFDLSKDAEPRVLFNGKYVLLKRAGGTQALAIGVCGVGEHVKASPYLVGTQYFGFVRGHLGAIGVDGKTRWFVGADRAMTDKLTLMADYTSGDENFSSLGASYQFTDHVGLLAGAQFPNEGGDTLFTVHLVINGPWAK